MCHVWPRKILFQQKKTKDIFGLNIAYADSMKQNNNIKMKQHNCGRTPVFVEVPGGNDFVKWKYYKIVCGCGAETAEKYITPENAFKAWEEGNKDE